MRFTSLIRRAANALGIDILRLHSSPSRTLLGLTQMNFGSVIDVGANEGQFARVVSDFFPKAELFCFEPLGDPFRKLSLWTATQNRQVECFNLALGDNEGEVEMHLHENHTPSSSLLAATEQNHRLYPQTRAERITRVRLTTLDQALRDHLETMRRDILLKLDVQGFEDRVLRGAERVLAECRACILEVCLDPLYEGQADFYGLTQLLSKAGFRYAGNLDQVYAGDGRVVYLDAVFVRS